MNNNRDLSFGYFRWLLILTLAGIAWFIFENGADILQAGGMSFHENTQKLSVPALKPSPNVPAHDHGA